MSWLFSIWTVVVCVAFLAIALWAWRGARKHEFDEAARIPLEDDQRDAADRGAP
jgi:cbb3-type cytochrome oxidase subunit 3